MTITSYEAVTLPRVRFLIIARQSSALCIHRACCRSHHYRNAHQRLDHHHSFFVFLFFFFSFFLEKDMALKLSKVLEPAGKEWLAEACLNVKAGHSGEACIATVTCAVCVAVPLVIDFFNANIDEALLGSS